MSELKKRFIKLMEDVDMGYQAPFDANSGNGITKFAPTPANKVLKNYNVDGDFLRKAIGYGGVASQAVDQIMTSIDSQPQTGVLGGGHFDTVIGGFDAPANGGSGNAIAGGAAVSPIGSGGDGMEAGAVPPTDNSGPADNTIDIEPVSTDISAGQTSLAPPEETPIDAGTGSAIGAIGGVGTGNSVGGEVPPMDDVQGDVQDDDALSEGGEIEEASGPKKIDLYNDGKYVCSSTRYSNINDCIAAAKAGPYGKALTGHVTGEIAKK